jgi:hypothetical protein
MAVRKMTAAEIRRTRICFRMAGAFYLGLLVTASGFLTGRASRSCVIGSA